VRDLPILERGFHPLSNFSPKDKRLFWGSVEGDPLTPSIEKEETLHFVQGDGGRSDRW